MHESLIVAILAGHGNPLDVAICRAILCALLAAPVVLFTVAGIQAVLAGRKRNRRGAWRYDRTYRLPRGRH